MKEKVFEYTVPKDYTVKIEQSENSFVVLIESNQVEFKDGDILADDDGFIAIYKNKLCHANDINYHALLNTYSELYFDDYCSQSGFKIATPEQQRIIFDALAKEGKQWNAEKKCIDPLKWQPKQDDEAHRVIFSREKDKFIIHSFTWHNGCKLDDCVMPSIKEANQLRDKLNAVLNEK